MGSVNSPLQSLDSLETHRFDEGVVRQALISEHSVPECDFVRLMAFRYLSPISATCAGSDIRTVQAEVSLMGAAFAVCEADDNTVGGNGRLRGPQKKATCSRLDVSFRINSDHVFQDVLESKS